jgi:signal transduction histidine kinase/ActR/RegA family two-component response regulator
MQTYTSGAQNYKFLLRLLMAACLCLCFWGAQPVAAAPVAVRVGYYYDLDYMHKDAGVYKGYNIDYMYAVANYANWQYQFVDYQGFNEAYTALQKGEIDILPALFPSPEREQQILFSNDDMGRVFVTLVVPENDNSHGYNDYASFKNMRVGVLTGSLDAKAFMNWSAAHDLTPRVVNLDDEEAMFSALEKGTVDALAITYLGNSSKYRIVAEFNPMPLYFGISRNRPDLKKSLDQALESLYFDNAAFKSTLNEKYFSMNKEQLPVFSKAEQEFLQKKLPVRVVLQLDNAPFCFEGEDGKPIGVIPDMFQKLAKISGLNFEYLTAPSMMDAIQMVEEGKADIVGKLTMDSVLAMSHHLRMTRPYMEVGLTQVTLKNGGPIRTVGVPVPLRSLFGDTITGAHGQPAHIVLMPNSNKAFDALKAGKIDAAYLNSASTNYLLNYSRTTEYNFSALPAHNYSLVVGIGLNSNPLLFGIINKCLRYVNRAAMDDAAVKYSLAKETTFSHFVNTLPPFALLIISILLLCMVIGLIFLVRKVILQGQEERALAAEKIRLDAVAKNAEEKNQFFANISHDLRTPLNAIIGFSGLAQNSNQWEEVQSYLQKIDSSGKLMLELVNDTLTMSKLRSGKLELKLEPVAADPQAFFATLFDVIREQTAKKNITFTVNCLPHLQRNVLVDKLNLQKILLNLLTNAVKYTPDGGHINVRFWEETAADGKPDDLISVQDDGIGIEPKAQSKIFEPFWQERRPGYEAMGTGLGLAIVKQLVTMMGGSITFTSAPDQGSTFTVRLRLPDAPAGTDVATAESTATTINTAAFTKLAGHKVLLCEDNQMNREIVVALLKSQGMITVTASDGQAGLTAFAASAPGEFAAILMDLRMPVLNGYEATRHIRALARPDAQTVPIIALTAETFAEDIQKCLDAGMNDHVGKPLMPNVLFATLTKYM